MSPSDAPEPPTGQDLVLPSREFLSRALLEGERRGSHWERTWNERRLALEEGDGELRVWTRFAWSVARLRLFLFALGLLPAVVLLQFAPDPLHEPVGLFLLVLLVLLALYQVVSLLLYLPRRHFVRIRGERLELPGREISTSEVRGVLSTSRRVLQDVRARHGQTVAVLPAIDHLVAVETGAGFFEVGRSASRQVARTVAEKLAKRLSVPMEDSLTATTLAPGDLDLPHWRRYPGPRGTEVSAEPRKAPVFQKVSTEDAVELSWRGLRSARVGDVACAGIYLAAVSGFVYLLATGLLTPSDLDQYFYLWLFGILLLPFLVFLALYPLWNVFREVWTLDDSAIVGEIRLLGWSLHRVRLDPREVEEILVTPLADGWSRLELVQDREAVVVTRASLLWPHGLDALAHEFDHFYRERMDGGGAR